MKNYFLLTALLLLSLNSSAQRIADHPEFSDERVVFHTNVGDMAFALYPQAAPQHVDQILKLTKLGIYNGASIFRIEKGFVAQVENFDTHTPPLSDEQRSAVKKIPAEFNAIKHVRGILSMARYDEDVNSAESSFSILLGNSPHLDGKYTVFGEVVGGQDVLNILENAVVDANHSPQAPVIVQNAEVVSAADLEKMKLAPAHEAEVPGQQARNWFLIFAAVTFSMTVFTAVYKTIFDKPPVAPSKSKA